MLYSMNFLSACHERVGLNAEQQSLPVQCSESGHSEYGFHSMQAILTKWMFVEQTATADFNSRTPAVEDLKEMNCTLMTDLFMNIR